MGVYDSVFKTVSAGNDYDFVVSHGLVNNEIFSNLCSGIPLQIGIDQSTSQIGFAARNAVTKEVLMTIDICNIGFPDKYEFKQYFKNYLKLILAGKDVRTCIYEIPVEHSPNIHVRRILNDLLSFMGELPKHIPELARAEMLKVNNLVWKTHFLKGKEYDGLRKKTEDVKYSAMQECNKLFPWTIPVSEYFKKPADSCDAIGILIGSFQEMESSFSEDIRKVNKLMHARPGVKYTHRVKSLLLADLREVAHKTMGNIDDMKVMEYNPDMKLDENCKRFVTNYLEVGALIVTSPKAINLLKWEEMVEIETDKHNLFVFVTRGG